MTSNSQSNYIDFSSFPKTKNNNIKWCASYNCEAPFCYNGINGIIKFIRKINNDKLEIEYNGSLFEIAKSSILKCKLNNIINPPIYKYNVGDTIKDIKRDFIIKEQIYKTRIRKNGQIEKDKAYIYHCNKCGWDNGEIIEFDVTSGKGCSCCAGRTIVPGINSVADTDPWIVDYFIGGYEEAIKYSRGYCTRMKFQCPFCGEISSETYISNILRDHGFSCKCKSGISYPEKFMKSFFESLGIDYIYQLRKLHFSWIKNYKYDFYLPKYNCIIEVHGAQHYKESNYFRITLEEQKKIDKNKENLAKKNNIQNYFTINASYGYFEWIKKSILSNKEFLELLEYPYIDWDNIKINIDKYNINSLNDIVNVWNENKNLSQKEVSNMVGHSISYTRGILQIAEKNGFLKETVSKRAKRLIATSSKKPIYCSQLNLFFNCLNTLKQHEDALFHCHLSTYGIYRSLNKEVDNYKGYSFSHIPKEEFEEVKHKTPELVYS